MLSFNVKIRNRLRWIYVITDLVNANLAIFCFNIFRWTQLPEGCTFTAFYSLPKIFGGQIVFPLLMMFIFWLSGYYNHVESRSRAQEALTSLGSACTGSLMVFFLAVVNDSPWRRRVVFENLFILAALLFVFVYLGRVIITRIEVRRVHERHHFSDALVIGTDSEAVALARRINGLVKGMGINVSALVRMPYDTDPVPGDFEVLQRADLERVLAGRGVGHIILANVSAMPAEEFSQLLHLAVSFDVPLDVSPDLNNLAMASRRQFNVLGEPLVCISQPSVSDFTLNLKRTIDVVLSAMALLVGMPVFLAVAVAIKIDSRGPVFFRQERVGYGARPFNIIKFRSMVNDAERPGEARLTVDRDPRVTRVGRILRKYRIDELPQFWNVIRGQMSLVGPRPERRAFADMIAARVPSYPMIYQVRPGITSWGMVRYGYASTVEEMVERLRYDMLYLETISISTDLKILLHTINTVLGGKGK